MRTQIHCCRRYSKASITLTSEAIKLSHSRLSDLPFFPNPIDLLRTAAKKANMIEIELVGTGKGKSSSAIASNVTTFPKSRIMNVRTRVRKLAAMQMDSFTKSVCMPIRQIVETHRRLSRTMHPFDAVVVNLTIQHRVKSGKENILSILEKIDQVRKLIQVEGNKFAAKCTDALTAMEARSYLIEGKDSIGKLIELEIMDIQRQIRRIPVVNFSLPTMVLVGSPNVGKSSIVRAISTGKPEIRDYPFTTRNLTIGHILVSRSDSDLDKLQIMDSPGLLNRQSDSLRNEMELLTIASISHLPTAVMFVMDLSGQAGDKSSIEDQLMIRKSLRERFPHRPWIDVFAKSDVDWDEVLRQNESDNNDKVQELQGMIPPDAIPISVSENVNIEYLRRIVISKLLELHKNFNKPE